MNQPQQPRDPPEQGSKSDHNPTGTTPNGIPEGMENEEGTGRPTSDRQQTEKSSNS